jgi:hypothetical protein
MKMWSIFVRTIIWDSRYSIWRSWGRWRSRSRRNRSICGRSNRAFHFENLAWEYKNVRRLREGRFKDGVTFQPHSNKLQLGFCVKVLIERKNKEIKAILSLS